MTRLLVVGSYNASLTVFSSELPRRGQTVLGDDLDIGPGGKGNNQAIAARRLGFEVTFVVKVGRDAFGNAAREFFQREGLPSSSVLDGRRGTGVALIMVDRSGDNLISVAPETNAELELADVVRLSPTVDNATHLLCQLECTVELFRGVALWARQRQMRVILNPAPAVELGDETYGLVDILTPNQTELQVLAGREVRSGDEVVEAARTLLKRGVGEVIVTLGDRGAIHVTPDAVCAYDAYPVDATDTTGAGDSFNGALAGALSAGAPMADAIDLAMRAAAFCVTRRGVIDGLPSRTELDIEVPSRVLAL